MAIRLSRLLKQHVVAMAEGRTLGRPPNIFIDPVQHRVAVIVMVSSDIPELTVVARARSVLSFESDTIAIEALTSLRIAAHDELALDLMARGVTLHGRPVLSSRGERLGTIKEVLIDDAGCVTEYWIRPRRFGFLRRSLKIHPDDLSAPAGDVAVVDQTERSEASSAEEAADSAASRSAE